MLHSSTSVDICVNQASAALNKKKFAPTSFSPYLSPNSTAFQLRLSSSAEPYSGAPVGMSSDDDGDSWKRRKTVPASG